MLTGTARRHGSVHHEAVDRIEELAEAIEHGDVHAETEVVVRVGSIRIIVTTSSVFYFVSVAKRIPNPTELDCYFNIFFVIIVVVVVIVSSNWPLVVTTQPTR